MCGVERSSEVFSLVILKPIALINAIVAKIIGMADIKLH
jgi:hypothetical protein